MGIDVALQNGGTKCTVIEAFDGTAVIIRPGFKKRFDALGAAMEFVEKKGWEVTIEYIKGTKIAREIRELCR